MFYLFYFFFSVQKLFYIFDTHFWYLFFKYTLLLFFFFFLILTGQFVWTFHCMSNNNNRTSVEYWIILFVPFFFKNFLVRKLKDIKCPIFQKIYIYVIILIYNKHHRVFMWKTPKNNLKQRPPRIWKITNTKPGDMTLVGITTLWAKVVSWAFRRGPIGYYSLSLFLNK